MATVNAGIGTVSAVANGGKAHVLNTAVAYTSGDLASFKNNGTEKASVDFEGTFTGHDGIFGGKVTIGETLAVVGVSTLAAINASGAYTQTSTNPQIVFIESDASADNARWDFIGTSETLLLRTVNDAVSVAANWGAVARTGTTVDSVTFAATTVAITGAATVSSTLTLAGLLSVDDTTQSTSTTSGSIHTDGGLGVVKDVFIGGDLAVAGTGPHAIGTVTIDRYQLFQSGSFTSGGSSTNAGAYLLNTSLTGAVGDTGFLTGAIFSADITTQGTDTNIGVVSQAYFDEPAITNNLASSGKPDVATTVYIVGAPTEGDVNAALYVAAGDVNFQSTLTLGGILSQDDTTQSTSTTTGSIHTDGGLGVVKDVFIGGDLNVAGTGPHAIGGATASAVGLRILGSFSPGSSSSAGSGVLITQAITGSTVHTTSLAHLDVRAGSITTAGSTTTHGIVASAFFADPNIVKTAGDTINVAATVYVQAAPTEGDVNAAVYVAAGDVMNAAGIFTFKEITTPTAVTNWGRIYTKTDNKLYFQDGAGTEHEVAFV